MADRVLSQERGWGKTERLAFAMRDLGEVAGDAAAALRQFDQAWQRWKHLLPAAVKPAFRGRRHGW